jgi:hypothetical protein
MEYDSDWMKDAKWTRRSGTQEKPSQTGSEMLCSVLRGKSEGMAGGVKFCRREGDTVRSQLCKKSSKKDFAAWLNDQRTHGLREHF